MKETIERNKSNNSNIIDKALEISQTVVVHTQNSVLCRNQILTWEQLPSLFPEQISRYKNQFGNKFTELLKFNNQLDLAREYVKKFIDDNKEIKSSSAGYLLQQLAPTYFGVGLCGECSMFALFELMDKFREQHIELPVLFITLEGNPASNEPGDLYSHVILVIGDHNLIQPGIDLNSLKKLPDEIICVDASIGWVGPLNQISSKNRQFFDLHGINRLSASGLISFVASNPKVQSVFAKVKELAIQLHQQSLENSTDKQKTQQCNTNITIFKDGVKLSIEAVLNKLSDNITKGHNASWRYYKKSDIALLTADVQEVAHAVYKFLQENELEGLHHCVERIKDNGSYVVRINKPNINQLNRIEIVSNDSNNETQSEHIEAHQHPL